MITGDRLIGRTAALTLLYAVFLCAAPTVTQAQIDGGNITGIAGGDSGSPMPGVQVSVKASLPYEFNLSFQRAVPFVQSIFANTLQPGMFPTGAFQHFQ